MHPTKIRYGTFIAYLCTLVTAGSCPVVVRAQHNNLIILADTGNEREGVPVLKLHPKPDSVEEVLLRGFSGRLLRLYQMEQEYLRDATGSTTEPAYLLLSDQRGGFPRFGFYLDNEDKRHAGYVDLHASSGLAGRFGSMDQIFPHELAHIIVRQLAGAPQQGGSNQLHAIGVRTDPYQAFQEGFAEHFQVMAVDDADADPATRALSSDFRLSRMAEAQARRYRRELETYRVPAGAGRMGFLFWFSGTEQVWRYHAVKADAFAHEVALPSRLSSGDGLYRAYLLQNVLPGDAAAPPRPVPVLLSIEGVVSSLFYRWAVDEEIRAKYRGEEFYRRFGVTRAEITPLENCYLKLFHALFVIKPADTAALIDGYKTLFPDEASGIDRVVRETLLGQTLISIPQIWLANPAFKTGTSLFDQYRSLPRTHTFDLNAATLVDLLGIPGLNRSMAQRILEAAPFADLGELRRVSGIPSALLAEFESMAVEMRRLTEGSAEEETDLSLSAILLSYVWRALWALALAASAGAVLSRFIRPAGWLRSGLRGFIASLLSLVLAWVFTGTGAFVALLAPVVLFGVPGSIWQLAKRRGVAQAALVLLAWGAAALPAVFVAFPVL